MDAVYRFAAPADAAALLRVYAPYIETGVTFETEAPSLEEFTRRVEAISRDYPYIVCERGGEILGYAYAHPAFERAAYRWDAELTVYLAQAACGERLGEALYRRVLALLRPMNVQTAYALVTSPNPRSERLHERMGFSRAAYFPDTGYKCNRWWGVTWYEMRLGRRENPPAEVRSLRDIPAEERERLLREGE